MIKISDVSKIFNDKSGEVVALRGVNLEIGRGDIFGIIGMSGAGKSTLLRCLSTDVYKRQLLYSETSGLRRNGPLVSVLLTFFPISAPRADLRLYFRADTV